MPLGLNPFRQNPVSGPPATQNADPLPFAWGGVSKPKATTVSAAPLRVNPPDTRTAAQKEDDFINFVFDTLQTTLKADDPVNVMLVDFPARFGHAARDLYNAKNPLPLVESKPADPLYDVTITDALDGFAKLASGGDFSRLSDLDHLMSQNPSEVLRLGARVLNPKAYAALLKRFFGATDATRSERVAGHQSSQPVAAAGLVELTTP
jgi:hypothetical protein